MRRTPLARLVTAALLGGAPLSAAPAAVGEGDPVAPEREAANFSKQNERASDYMTPKALADQLIQGQEAFTEGVVEQASDPSSRATDP